MDAALARFERAKLKLEGFRQEHARIITTYLAMKAEVDTSFEEAKAVYDANKSELGPSYGGFSVSVRRAVDAQLLVELFPDAITFVKYSLTLDVFDQLRAEGTITDDVAEQVEFQKEAILGPKK